MFFFFILPVDCIINDNHHYLEEFLEGLAVPEHSATIQDWDIAGRVYLDYIRVIKSLQDIQQVRRPTSLTLSTVINTAALDMLNAPVVLCRNWLIM